LAEQRILYTLSNTLTNERTKRKHMEDEQIKLKTQIQQRIEDSENLKNNLCNIKNNSLTADERSNQLNIIYNVSSFFYLLNT